jgi:hypothetical protein
MTELDLAFEKYRQDDVQQVAYYDCVLNTDFYCFVFVLNRFS